MDDKDPYFLTNVSLFADDYALVGAMYTHLSEDNIDHTLLLRKKAGIWESLKFDSASIGSWIVDFPEPAMITVGVEGSVYRFDRNGQSEEAIDDSDEGPSDLVLMRCGSIVDSQLVVAGMARRVYVRNKAGSWNAIDGGTFLSRSQRTSAVGFFTMAASSLKNLYAFGFGGEIWHYDGTSWKQDESPTNLALTGATMSADGTVHVVGQLGTYIRGSLGQWEVVEGPNQQEDFWSALSFNGSVYFASHSSLFRLEGGIIEPIDADALRGGSFGKLACSKNVMWSVGENHIFETTDGENWELVELP